MKDKNCIRCKSCLQLCFRPRQWSRHDPFPVHRLTPVRLENSFNRIKVHRYSVGIAVFTTALLSFQPNTGGGWPNCEGGEKRTKADSRSFLSPPLFPLFFLFLSFFFYFSFRLRKYRVSHLYTDKNHRNSKCCGVRGTVVSPSISYTTDRNCSSDTCHRINLSLVYYRVVLKSYIRSK